MEKYFEINEAGLNIRCKIYYKDLSSISRCVLFCHGFGGHKDNKAAQRFAERVISKCKGTAVVTFNWPCHGDDVKKKLRLDDCTAYMDLMLAHIRNKLGAQEIYSYATSFGGYLVLKYIHEKGNPFKKVALRCPAVNMRDVLVKNIMTDDDLEKLAKGKEIQVGFDRKIKIDQAFLDELGACDITAFDYLDYAEDIMILQGTKDEIVSFDDVQAFADNSLIEFIPVADADHRFKDPLKMDIAIQKIMEFMAL